MSTTFLASARALEAELIARRRDFHRHPELGFQEERTARIVAQELTQLGLEVKIGVAKTGVIGLLKGEGPGSTVLLRFDMGALPIVEANETDYVSTTPGVMHACGHDGHTAIGLAVAKMMAGTLKFVFQPAEEGQGGAERMVREGVLENPAPDVALALHLWNEMPLGTVGVTPGPTMAGQDRPMCLVTGTAGHGALPHRARDPVVAAAHIITALQSVVSRNLNPLDAAVVSVGTLSAGQTFNVIPERVEFSGTLRTFESEVRETVLRRVCEIVEGIASAMGCVADLSIELMNPPVVNDADIASVVREVARDIVGEDQVRTERTMGSDDIAYMMETVPACYFFIGSANAQKGLDHPHHNPRFDFDESALVLGAAIIASATARYVLE